MPQELIAKSEARAVVAPNHRAPTADRQYHGQGAGCAKQWL